MIPVYLCDGDGCGWAIDEDVRLTRAALERTGLVRFVKEPDEARVIHACWWEPLMRLPFERVRGRHVVCHMVGEPARCLAEPPFQAAMARVTHWIAQSAQAFEQLAWLAPSAGFGLSRIPYAVDVAEFASGPEADAGDPLAAALRERIPCGAYVVASFHRDTAAAGLGAAGGSKPSAKLIKGPDVLVEILARARELGAPVFALLAGPRRHWIREALRRREVPFAFVGELRAGDDLDVNVLPRRRIGTLYRAAHAHVCTSRSEGGPRAILEAAAAGLSQLSTPVGLAPDVLRPECVFRDAIEAAEKLARDARDGWLRRLAPVHAQSVRVEHTVDANVPRFAELYQGLGVSGPAARAPRAARPAGARERPRRVCLWNHFTPPPWGGGNQFMLALRGAMERAGVEVTVNGEDHERRPATAHILNSVQFEVDRFRAVVQPGGARVVHRIDGPISVLRGTPDSLEQDRLCFALNARYATATVIQSRHTLRFLTDMGFEPVRPALITNAPDPANFFPAAAPARPEHGEPLRIIASAWSPSPGKGAAIYQWLDEHLDPSRFRFTFVGNCPAVLRHARVVPPRPSRELGELLREHHVYLTASRNDPCSNALIEALCCGLPALYLDSGGHAEIVGAGGLPFTRPSEIPAALERLRDHLAVYRRLIQRPGIDAIARAYLDLALGEAPYRE
ncbi:MAG: glycosyltransferase family 4 protein [Phycisphaerae bacterium]|nr:glycosyltransferase family 4 protein [Phycisphaerae bacterium]